MKLQQLVQSELVLGQLVQQTMSAGVAFRMAMLAKQVAPFLDQFHKQRDDLIRKLGIEKDGQVEVPREKMGELAEALNEMLAEEVAVTFEAFSPDALGSIQITPADVLALEWLFKKDGTD